MTSSGGLHEPVHDRVRRCASPSALFPRLLLAIWSAISRCSSSPRSSVVGGPLPSAVSSALQGVLEGNVKKVLVSMALWLPYLILSTRVNVTYRQRVPG